MSNDNPAKERGVRGPGHSHGQPKSRQQQPIFVHGVGTLLASVKLKILILIAEHENGHRRCSSIASKSRASIRGQSGSKVLILERTVDTVMAISFA